MIRQTLRNLSLVNDTDNTRGCGRKQTKGWRCNVCTTTHFCTIQVGVTPVAKKAGRISFLSLLSGSRHWKDQTNDEDALQEGAPIGRNFAGTFFPVLQLIFFEKNNLLGIIDSILLLSSSALSTTLVFRDMDSSYSVVMKRILARIGPMGRTGYLMNHWKISCKDKDYFFRGKL